MSHHPDLPAAFVFRALRYINTIIGFCLEAFHQFVEDIPQKLGILTQHSSSPASDNPSYQELQQLNDELKQANAQLHLEIQQQKQHQKDILYLAEVGKLAAMIVHEIRNPLTTIFLALTSLKPLSLGESTQMRLALALEEAERLQRLLSEILLYARQQPLQYSELDVNQLMSEMQDAIWSIPAATGRQIKLTSSLPEAWIMGDRDKLKQVFINLLKNACEAVNEGDVIVWSAEWVAASNQVRICVHNPGDPIPPELVRKLGTPFYTTKTGGNGLGLAIVRQIVEAHGGELTVQSECCTGTNICVQFPLLYNKRQKAEGRGQKVCD